MLCLGRYPPAARLHAQSCSSSTSVLIALLRLLLCLLLLCRLLWRLGGSNVVAAFLREQWEAWSDSGICELYIAGKIQRRAWYYNLLLMKQVTCDGDMDCCWRNYTWMLSVSI